MKKLMGVFILFFVFGTNVSYGFDLLKEIKSCLTGGCDPVKAVKTAFDNTAEEAGRNMAKGTSEVFKQTMNELFDTKIAPLIKEITSAQKEIIDHASSEIGKNIDHASSETGKNIDQLDAAIRSRLEQISSVMQDAIDKFSKATNETIDKIKKEVIDNTFNKLDQLHTELRRDIDDFFKRVNYLVETVDCTGEKFAKDVETLAAQLRRWSTIFRSSADDFCFKSVGISKFPARNQYTTLYKLEKCYRLIELNPHNTTIEHIRDVYVDLRASVNRVSCIQRGAAEEKHFREEWWKLGSSYDFWTAYAKK